MKQAMRFLSHSIASLVVLIVPAGCGDQSTTGPPAVSVFMNVQPAPPAGDAAHPVRLTTSVLNAGAKPIWHVSECGDGPGIGIRVLGPDGTEVLLRDPYAMPACPDSQRPLEPGGSLALAIDFTGTLYFRSYEPSGERTYPAPPGTYTVVAHFGYSVAGSMEALQVERSVTFEWGP